MVELSTLVRLDTLGSFSINKSLHIEGAFWVTLHNASLFCGVLIVTFVQASRSNGERPTNTSPLSSPVSEVEMLSGVR